MAQLFTFGNIFLRTFLLKENQAISFAQCNFSWPLAATRPTFGEATKGMHSLQFQIRQQKDNNNEGFSRHCGFNKCN